LYIQSQGFEGQFELLDYGNASMAEIHQRQEVVERELGVKGSKRALYDSRHSQVEMADIHVMNASQEEGFSKVL
jgi:hypothetical protein